MKVQNNNYIAPIEVKITGVEKQEEQEILFGYIRTALRVIKKSRSKEISYKIEID